MAIMIQQLHSTFLGVESAFRSDPKNNGRLRLKRHYPVRRVSRCTKSAKVGRHRESHMQPYGYALETLVREFLGCFDRGGRAAARSTNVVERRSPPVGGCGSSKRFVYRFE